MTKQQLCPQCGCDWEVLVECRYCLAVFADYKGWLKHYQASHHLRFDYTDRPAISSQLKFDDEKFRK